MSFGALADVAYALDLAEDAWVRELCVYGRSLLDEGSGMFAYSYDLVGADVTLRAVAIEGQDAEASGSVWNTLNAWGARNQELVVASYRLRPVQIVSFAGVASVSKQVARDLRATFEPHDIRDMFAFVAHHPSGSGVILTVPLTRSRVPTRLEERAFSEVGSTLAAIVRLRRRRQAAQRRVDLTITEREVAALLLHGCSDKEIAHEMGIAMSSVSTLTQRIRRKLGCATGEELLLLSEPDEEAILAQRRSLFGRLTAAEREVAVELLAGATYAEIAQGRGCSVRTVAAQSASLFRKTGVSGRRALTAAALGGHSSGK